MEGWAPDTPVPFLLLSGSNHTQRNKESKMSQNTLAERSNRYGAKCAKCTKWVPAEAGVLTKHAGRWQVHCKGQCAASAPKKEFAAPGYYVGAENEFMVVVTNRAGTATYAKRLVVSKSGGRTKARWHYAPGLAATVASSRPMTLIEATKFGHLHGVCLVCCRQLTDPESVQRGIGPVCAKRFN